MSCHFQNTRRTSGRPGMARSAGTAGSAMSRSRCSCIRRINSSLGSVELACSMVSDDGRYQPTFRSNWSWRLVAGSRLASGGGGGGGSAMAGSSMAAAAIRLDRSRHEGADTRCEAAISPSHHAPFPPLAVAVRLRQVVRAPGSRSAGASSTGSGSTTSHGPASLWARPHWAMIFEIALACLTTSSAVRGRRKANSAAQSSRTSLAGVSAAATPPCGAVHPAMIAARCARRAALLSRPRG